jgi:hypothetical protein
MTTHDLMRQRAEAAEARVKELEEVLNAVAKSEWFHGGMGVYDPKHMTQLRAQIKAALAETKGTPRTAADHGPEEYNAETKGTT